MKKEMFYRQCSSNLVYCMAVGESKQTAVNRNLKLLVRHNDFNVFGGNVHSATTDIETLS
jgi:hypothetical protein